PPENVPNQYQVIQVWPDRLERWTRRFDPEQKRWIGDARCSEDGNAWHVVHPVTFLSVDRAFPPMTPTANGGTITPLDEYKNRIIEFFGSEDLKARGRSRFEEVCSMRHNRQASIRPKAVGDPPLNYLLVTARDEMSVQQYPVGVFERPLTETDLD